jgi:uncharacterized protein YjbI with pentapeptide repeats
MKTKNLTPFPFGAKLTARRPPELEMTMIVRGAFRLAPNEPVTPLVEIPQLSQGSMTAETFRDDDADRSGECLYGGDFADFKLNAEVMLRGTCYAPNAEPVSSCPIKLAVGGWSKVLSVTGRRLWSDGFSGAAMSEAIPFAQMPLGYSNAFGGPGYALNPVGKGFGTGEVPSIELGRELVRSRGDRPTPAGFGPINPAWPQRSGKMGKEYGRSYREKRAPFYAEDFDWTYFQAAPADQQLPGYLRGDEEIVLQNLHPSAQVLTARLPGLRIRAFVNDVSGRFREVRMNLDTLFLDPDAATLYLTWRGLDRVTEDDLADVKTTLIVSEEIGKAPLAEAHYRAVLETFEADPLEVRAKFPAESLDLLAKVESLAASGGPPTSSEPAPDAVSGRLRGKLDLLDLETRGKLEREVSGAFSAIGGAPGPSADVTSAFDKAVAAIPVRPPPTAMPAKPGVMPPLPIGDKLRQARAAITDAREQARAAGADVSQIEKLEALLADPRLAPLDQGAREGGPPPIEPGPGRDLSGRDFTGIDLRGRDLRGASFDGSILTRADLRGACLADANLKHAVFLQANLAGADLSGADLTMANLTEAQAEGVDLSRATLVRTFARKANLASANLTGATGEFVVFTEVDLTGARARGLRLFKALFRDCDFSRADLADARLSRCYFLGVRAREMSLASAELHHTSFSGSDLSRARIVDARGAGTIFLKATLDGADFSYSVFPAAHFTEAHADAARFHGANLKGARFYRASLVNADFTRSNLFSADLGKALLTGARFNDANLYDAKFLKSAGTGCDFSGANLKRSTLEGA